MFWWVIKWKSFAESDLMVSEKQADYINQQLDLPDDQRQQFFKINGERYSYGDIRRVERTTKRIEDETKKLYAGEAMRMSKEPMIDGEGCVVTNWYKKLITPKEFESYYSKHHGYHVLSRDANEIWIGIRVVEMENGTRPEHLELCTEQEAERLWAYSKAS